MIPCPLRLYLSDALRDPRPRNLELAGAGDHALGFAVGSPARTRTVTLRSDQLERAALVGLRGAAGACGFCGG
jgi:hypothetical protein